MDNPSSVITQVSRDEEGGKAAGERGESGFTSAHAHLENTQQTSLQTPQLEPGKSELGPQVRTSDPHFEDWAEAQSEALWPVIKVKEMT